MVLQDILAAIAVVMNGLPQALLALTFGFAAFPTALAFVAGTAGVLFFNSVAPISFQAESIVMAGTMGKTRSERLNIVFYTGIIMVIVGALGLLQPTIDFIGPSILNAMMAGVGIILAKVGVDMTKENRIVGGSSVFVALLTFFISGNLVYTIVLSVFASAIVHTIVAKRTGGVADVEVNFDFEKLTPLKFKVNRNIIKSTLALVTLQVGGNIAYASITGSLAGASVNVDQITLYSGIGDAISAYFGGAPVEAIISGTAVAPHPVMAGALMMIIMAAVLFAKVVPRIAKHVPSQTIAGFLFVLGAIIVFPGNMLDALGGNPVVAGVTAIVTATIDPFVGMMSGIALRFIMSII